MQKNPSLSLKKLFFISNDYVTEEYKIFDRIILMFMYVFEKFRLQK